MCSSALECVGANSTKDEMPADTFNFTQPASLPVTVAFEIASKGSSFAVIYKHKIRKEYIFCGISRYMKMYLKTGEYRQALKRKNQRSELSGR